MQRAIMLRGTMLRGFLAAFVAYAAACEYPVGVTPYTYTWYKDGSRAGTGQELAIFTGTTDFGLRVEITDHVGQMAEDSIAVDVTPSTFVLCGT